MTIQQVETCAHLEADSTGAKVQYPDGTLGCFWCWSERPRIHWSSVPNPEDDAKEEREAEKELRRSIARLEQARSAAGKPRTPKYEKRSVLFR